MDIRSVFGNSRGISAFGVTVLCFVFTYLFFGFYRVEYEGMNTAFFGGSLTPGLPFRSLYFSGNMGISYLYSYLYEYFPGVEWLSWLEYTYLILACTLGLYLLSVLLPQGMPRWLPVLCQVLVYVLVFADHNIHLLYTRVAYMACGLSLLGMLVLYRSRADIKARPGLFVLLNLFFTIGTLTRVEAAVAAFLLLLTFGLAYQGNVRQTLLLFLYPFLVVGSLSAFLAVDIKTAKAREFYKQVEPDIEEQFIARENRVPLSHMKTRRDSVIYTTATDMMWSDPQVISAPYLRSLILPEKWMFTDARQWQRVYHTVGDMLAKYRYLVFFSLFLGLVLVFVRGFRGPFWAHLFFLIFLLSFWVLTALQTYTDKINERSFVPLMSLFILCQVLWLIDHVKRPGSALGYLLLVAAGLFSVAQVRDLRQEAAGLATAREKYRRDFSEMEQVAGGHYLLVNSTVFDCLFLGNGPFRPYDFSAFRKMYITDGYIIPFLPYYKRYLEQECRCDIYDFPSFWRYALALDGDVFVVSNAHRMRVTATYLQELYGLSLPLEEIGNPSPNGTQDDAVKAYRLR